MILPTKHLREDRALLQVGAEILAQLSEPKTISRVWDDLKAARASGSSTATVTFDWFVLALDLLYILDAIEKSAGRLGRSKR